MSCGTNEVLREIEELDLREGVARQGELDDRHARGVVDENDGRGDAGRQLLQDGLRDRGDLSLRGVDVDGRLEKDLDHADARQRLRLDVLDVVDGGRQCALVGRDDAARHVVGRQAGVAPHRGNDGNADVGKNVGRRSESGESPEYEDEDRHHDEGVGARQRQAHDGGHGVDARAAEGVGKPDAFKSMRTFRRNLIESFAFQR